MNVLFYTVALIFALASFSSNATSRLKVCINPGWRFHFGQIEGEPYAVAFDDRKWELVSLPHSHCIFESGLAGFNLFGREVGWYRRELVISKEWSDKRVYLEFQGAMQDTTLWVNGRKVGNYAVSGYDSFHFDLTQYLVVGTNLLAVEVDNRMNREIPPDGARMDYVLFGGLYRNVFLHVTDPLHVTFPWEAKEGGLRVTIPEISKESAVIDVSSSFHNDSTEKRSGVVAVEIRDKEEKLVERMEAAYTVGSGESFTAKQRCKAIKGPHLWCPEDPYLYKVVTLVLDGNREVDRVITPVGLRWVSFDSSTGFYLNGHHLKLVGANYHQTWPFIGGAVPDALRRRDAEQMKAMGINWVRLSHYPHAPDFLDALDELGLMAVAEGPSWITAGPGIWKYNMDESFRRMIRRGRNHPCVILWNACINHQKADEALVQIAIQEDPTRDRGQDTVPTPMDFPVEVISGMGALTIEHTGHTFPAERGARAVDLGLMGGRFRAELGNREYEQTVRHLRQINAALLKDDNSGLAVWCMYDYNTFHNTDASGLVWHGVCDLFRIPKYSFWWHQSELTTNPMAYVVRVNATNATVFSNCEKVRLLEDRGIGYVQVGSKVRDLKYTNFQGRCISYALQHPPISFVVGTNARCLKAEGIEGEKVVASFEWKEAKGPVGLVLETDRPVISADGADLSRIVVTAVDENGTAVDGCDAQVSFEIEGLGQLIGENPTRLRSGKMIILAQSAFVPGVMTITARSQNLRPATLKIETCPPPQWMDLPKNLSSRQPSPRVVANKMTSNPNRNHKR